MEEIRKSKEFKAVQRALMLRLKVKAKPDALIKDLVRRYMDAWVLARKANEKIEKEGDCLVDSRDRLYSNPAIKNLSDAEALMDRLQKVMDIKTDDLVAAQEDEDDDL